MFFTIRIIIFVIIRCYVLYVWTSYLGVWGVVESALVYSLGRFYEIIILEIVINLALAFECRYIKFGQLLKATNATKFAKHNKDLGTISRLLTEANLAFNSIFGWVLLFITGKEFMQLLESSNYVLVEFPSDDKNFESFVNGLIIENGLQAIYTLVRL